MYFHKIQKEIQMKLRILLSFMVFVAVMCCSGTTYMGTLLAGEFKQFSCVKDPGIIINAKEAIPSKINRLYKTTMGFPEMEIHTLKISGKQQGIKAKGEFNQSADKTYSDSDEDIEDDENFTEDPGPDEGDDDFNEDEDFDEEE